MWVGSSKNQIKLMCWIMVIFGVNHGYEMLNDHFEFNHNALGVLFGCAWLGIELVKWEQMD